MSTLVTGGAGYIGRHVVRALLARGERVAVVDLPGGSVRDDRVAFLGLDLADTGAVEPLTEFLRRNGVASVIHLAARKRVDESVARPAWYFQQNVGGLVTVLLAAEAAGVRRIVFSSTAAVYASSPRAVTEDDLLEPSNPYGHSKLAGEKLVDAHAEATGGAAISLRYFNVAGSEEPALAEAEPHNLIPLVVRAIRDGRPPVIYGDDYDTIDGTCVRDYVHVSDIAAAHLAALDALDSASGHRVYNVGTGDGASVREVVGRLLELAGSGIVPRVEPRREGDPAIVVADATRLRTDLGWSPAHDLGDILRSAWAAR